MELVNVEDNRVAELARAEFLAELAHELRTPLSALRVSLDLLRDPNAPSSPEEHRRLVETIDRSLQRLERHVTDMLEIGYLERNAPVLRSERIDVGTPVAEALDATTQHAMQRNVAIDLALEGDLPRFTADPARLAQILTNLLTNAIKFSPLGGRVELDVSTAAVPADGGGRTSGRDTDTDPGPSREIVISVKDRGPGVAEGDQEKVFQPFS